jgi:hypothetical protein
MLWVAVRGGGSSTGGTHRMGHLVSTARSIYNINAGTFDLLFKRSMCGKRSHPIFDRFRLAKLGQSVFDRHEIATYSALFHCGLRKLIVRCTSALRS